MEVSSKIEYVFIDTSYYVFYKMYATLAWFSFSKTEVTEAELLTRYQKTFEKEIKDIIKRYSVDGCQVIFAKDTPRDQVWRMELFPTYKACRDNTKHVYACQIFAHTYNIILPKLCGELGSKIIYVNGAEADDVVAVCQRMVRVLRPNANTVIVTNDNDYLQLLDDKTIIINLKKLQLKDRIFDTAALPYIAQIKAISGDKSDNVPPIAAKIGEKTAFKMVLDPSLLEKKLGKSEEIRKQFELNTVLVNFDYIPDHLIKQIEMQFWEVCGIKKSI
jgi:5'-3' exonuclease